MLSTVEKVLHLKAIDLFGRIPGELLARVAGVCTEENRDAGETLATEGEAADALYALLEGKVRIYKAERLIAELGVRESFGEVSVLDAAPSPVTVTAATSCRLLRLGREDFHEVLLENPELAVGIIQVLSRRLRDVLG